MRKAYSGAAFTSLQPLVLSALMLPATAYVIRGMGATEYGQWVTATTLVAVVTFATTFALRVTFVRAVARYPDAAAGALAHQLGMRLCLSLLAASVAVLACAFLGYAPIVLACTAISAFGLILATMANTAADFLQGFQRLGVVASANMASGLLLTASSVAVVTFGLGPIGVSLAYLVGPIVSLSVMFSVVARRHCAVRFAFSVERMKALFWEQRYLGGVMLVHSVSTNAEALLLPALAGEKPFGVFSGASLLASRLGAIPDGVASALYPAVVEADARHGPRDVVRLVTRFLLLALVATVGIAVFVSVFAEPFARLLLPAEAEAATQVMRITIWLLPVMAVVWVLGAALNGLNGDAAQARAGTITAFVNIALTPFLVWKFGLIGAAWSMVARYVVWLAVFIPCSLGTFRPVLRAAREEPRGLS